MIWASVHFRFSQSLEVTTSCPRHNQIAGRSPLSDLSCKQGIMTVFSRFARTSLQISACGLMGWQCERRVLAGTSDLRSSDWYQDLRRTPAASPYLQAAVQACKELSCASRMSTQTWSPHEAARLRSPGSALAPGGPYSLLHHAQSTIHVLQLCSKLPIYERCGEKLAASHPAQNWHQKPRRPQTPTFKQGFGAVFSSAAASSGPFTPEVKGPERA